MPLVSEGRELQKLRGDKATACASQRGETQQLSPAHKMPEERGKRHRK